MNSLKYVRCHYCNYVEKTDTGCSHCKVENVVKTVYPDFHTYQMQEIILQNYQLGLSDSPNPAEIILEYVDAGKFSDLINEIKNLFSNPNFHPDINTQIEILKKYVVNQPKEKLYLLLNEVLQFSPVSNPHIAVVVLSSELLNKLLDNIIFDVSIIRGLKRKKARRRIIRLPNFERRCEEFEKECRITLQNTLKKSPFNSFYTDWLNLIETNKKYRAGIPFSIEANNVEKARTLVEQSLNVFSYLNNEYCTKK